MNTYDFRSLNDKEFEAMAIDLLAAENGIRIERFKPGKDCGVDGRWFATPHKEAIIQCKHWVGSGYRSLAKHLRSRERAKLDNLQCARYVLVTSVPLSRQNKVELALILAPYVLSESDIIGAEDLNDMLGRRSDVERRHYKLWLFEAGYGEAKGKHIIYVASENSVLDTKRETEIHFDIHRNVQFFRNHKQLKTRIRAVFDKNKDRLLSVASPEPLATTGEKV